MEADWARGHENVLIPCFNNIDDEKYPVLVEYCKEVIIPPQYREQLAQSSALMAGCTCGDDCTHCPCRTAYTAEGLLLDLSRPVLECHAQCQCSVQCCNRQVSKGLQHALALVKTARKGWALTTRVPIPRGSFVLEYSGELISTRTAQLRFVAYDQLRANYLLVVREWSASQNQFLRTNVDATTCGNVARFMNHSCAPNTVLVPARTGSLVPRLALFACTDISPGEELTFDYGATDSQVTGVKCQCGTSTCKGWLPRDTSV